MLAKSSALEPAEQMRDLRRRSRLRPASPLTQQRICADTPSTVKSGVAEGALAVDSWQLRSLSVLAGYAVSIVLGACANPPPPNGTGKVGGRVLVAPGVGLAGAHVEIDQVNLYDGKAQLRKHVGETETDASGNFPALATGTIN